MHLCYIDESGTSEVPGVSSHFVLAGVSIPISKWRDADLEITAVLAKYGLADAELHTGWLLHNYLEQSRIPKFESLDWAARRSSVERERAAYLLKLQRAQKSKTLRQTKKTYRHTSPYIHLTRPERLAACPEVADCVASWPYARLFAECIDKLHFDPVRTRRSVDEQAFEQVVSRFERYLDKTAPNPGQKNFGLLVHDNNQSVALKHTRLMRDFHAAGTLWIKLAHIVETPLFVDSSLTRMIQIADPCSYAIRRYAENKEDDLFDRLFVRADRVGKYTVGVRHYSDRRCACKICASHS